MPPTEKKYTRVIGAEEMIKELQSKYPDLFWAIRTETVCVMGVENKTRSKGSLKKRPFYASLRPMKGVNKAILEINNVATRYAIEVFWDEWNDWDEGRRQWMIAEQLLKIPFEEGQTNKYDCAGFKVLLDKIGVTALTDPKAKLPNMLIQDIQFNLDLRPGLDEEAGESEEDKVEVTEEEDDGELFEV